MVVKNMIDLNELDFLCAVSSAEVLLEQTKYLLKEADMSDYYALILEDGTAASQPAMQQSSQVKQSSAPSQQQTTTNTAQNNAAPTMNQNQQMQTTNNPDATIMLKYMTTIANIIKVICNLLMKFFEKAQSQVQQQQAQQQQQATTNTQQTTTGTQQQNTSQPATAENNVPVVKPENPGDFQSMWLNLDESKQLTDIKIPKLTSAISNPQDDTQRIMEQVNVFLHTFFERSSEFDYSTHRMLDNVLTLLNLLYDKSAKGVHHGDIDKLLQQLQTTIEQDQVIHNNGWSQSAKEGILMGIEREQGFGFFKIQDKTAPSNAMKITMRAIADIQAYMQKCKEITDTSKYNNINFIGKNMEKKTVSILLSFIQTISNTIKSCILFTNDTIFKIVEDINKYDIWKLKWDAWQKWITAHPEDANMPPQRRAVARGQIQVQPTANQNQQQTMMTT